MLHQPGDIVRADGFPFDRGGFHDGHEVVDRPVIAGFRDVEVLQQSQIDLDAVEEHVARQDVQLVADGAELDKVFIDSGFIRVVLIIGRDVHQPVVFDRRVNVLDVDDIRHFVGGGQLGEILGAEPFAFLGQFDFDIRMLFGEFRHPRRFQGVDLPAGQREGHGFARGGTSGGAGFCRFAGFAAGGQSGRQGGGTGNAEEFDRFSHGAISFSLIVLTRRKPAA